MTTPALLAGHRSMSIDTTTLTGVGIRTFRGSSCGLGKIPVMRTLLLREAKMWPPVEVGTVSGLPEMRNGLASCAWDCATNTKAPLTGCSARILCLGGGGIKGGLVFPT